MLIKDFETELKELDPRLSIVQNPNRANIANIKLNGQDVCPIPANEIREERDPTYCIEMPNGMMIPHRSRQEALIAVKHILEYIKTPEGNDVFFAQNGY